MMICTFAEQMARKSLVKGLKFFSACVKATDIAGTIEL